MTLDLSSMGLTADRLRAGPLDEDHRRFWHLMAWPTILVLFALGWGMGTIRALQAMTGGAAATPVTSANLPTMLIRMGLTLGAVLSALLVLKAARATFTDAGLLPVGRAAWIRQGKAFCVYPIGVALGFAAIDIASQLLHIPQFSYPQYPFENVWLEILANTSSALAGPSEELALLGVVVWTLRRGGYNWGVVLVTAVIVRLPFHLYYGAGTFAMLIWPVLTVLLYRRTGALLAIVLAHSFWNVSTDFGAVGDAFRALVALTGVFFLIQSSWRHIAADKARDHAQRAAATPPKP